MDKDYYNQYWEERINEMEMNNNLNKSSLKRIVPIKSLLPSNKSLGKVLDVGCGDGTILYMLQKDYEIEPYGIDISINAMNKAKERGIKTKISNLNQEIPFPENYFNTILCTDVLEHLFSPENALQEIYRVSKEDALIIFSIPNFGHLKNRIQFLLGKNITEPPFQVKSHIRFWNQKSFVKLLKKNGFIMEKSTSVRGNTLLYKLWKNESLFSNYMYIKAKKDI
ncbi:MAG: methyltransferase domain-containing protein [Euryarchaeota archaeon]|jgi:methionine biosynthesis protein MetW|nr:methyltransferase domain-containing protein [Euryarchaeota archaeon]HHT18062.1 methyltransferase domain-containing protein [Methanobacterium sp.]